VILGVGAKTFGGKVHPSSELRVFRQLLSRSDAPYTSIREGSYGGRNHIRNIWWLLNNLITQHRTLSFSSIVQMTHYHLLYARHCICSSVGRVSLQCVWKPTLSSRYLSVSQQRHLSGQSWCRGSVYLPLSIRLHRHALRNRLVNYRYFVRYATR